MKELQKMSWKEWVSKVSKDMKEDPMFTKPGHDMYREKPAGYIELPGEWVGYGMRGT